MRRGCEVVEVEVVGVVKEVPAKMRCDRRWSYFFVFSDDTPIGIVPMMSFVSSRIKPREEEGGFDTISSITRRRRRKHHLPNVVGVCVRVCVRLSSSSLLHKTPLALSN